VRHITIARSSAERLSVALLSLIATCGIFHQYLPPFKRLYMWSDIEGYHYPLHQFAFHALKEGRLPAWDPSIYCGISLVGNVQAALLYPPTWLMYAAVWTWPDLPFKALEIFTILHVWVGFLLCYLWLRGHAGKLASALGAAIFAYGGFMMYEVLHPGVVCAMAWMPLGLWGIDQAVERRDWRPLWKVAAASALSFLAGYPACWIVYAVAAVVYALASRARWRAAVGVCAALVASALPAAIQLLPAMEARSKMVVEPKYGPGAYDLRTNLLTYFVPNWFDYNPGHPTDYNAGCIYLYVGLPAAFGLIWAVRRHRIGPYLQPLACLAAALLLANPPHFLMRAVEWIPPLNNTMQPFNFDAAVAAMTALIAAIGVNDFLKQGPKRMAPRWLVPVTAAALSVWLLRQLWITGHGGRFATGAKSAEQMMLALAIFALGLWTLRAAAGRRRTALAALVLLFAGVDYRVYGAGRWFNALRGDHDKEPRYGIGGVDDDAYRAMLQNRQYRVVTTPETGPSPTDFRVSGLATPQGFDPFLPAQYKETIQHWVPFQTNRVFFPDLRNENMLQTLGVRYLLVRDGSPDDAALAASPHFRRLGRKNIFCHVYDYLRARPPFYWEDQRAGGTAEPTAWLPELREFNVQSERGGRFVFVEQYFPGWTAAVDGNPVRIERWGGAFQAIAVPAGEHRLRFEFNSPGFAIGVSALAGAAVLLALVLRCG
jgi:hypothetical protein